MLPFGPQTRLGRVACGLAVAFVAWWGLNLALFWLSLIDQPSGATRPAIIVLSWLGMACGVAAGAVAVLALVRRHERSIAVLLCLAPGLFAVAFLAGELLFPH